MLYSINEIFYSIQGEGYWTGRPAVFIRLAGCNLSCPWCDTDHSERQKADEGWIATVIDKLIVEHTTDVRNVMVILTGGEPSLQPLEPLVDLLHELEFYVAIETNGTHMRRIPTGVNWITFSPKPDVDYKKIEVCRADEVKIIFDGVIEPEAVWKWTMADHYYIQPCSENFGPAVQYVKENPKWRLSIQTQKVLSIS